MRTSYLLPILLFVSAACEQLTEWELNPEGNGQLVVEAILTDESKIQEIKLSQSYDTLNTNPPSITDAVITLEANGSFIAFLPDSDEPGSYKSEVALNLIENLNYNLSIGWQDQDFSATSRLSVVAPIPELFFSENETGDSLQLLQLPIFNSNQQAMYDILVDWSHLDNNPESKIKVRFYTFETIEPSQIFGSARSPLFFPRGSIIIIKKFGLNDDFAAYLRAVASETDWNGGLLYNEPYNLPSNIKENGLGFFSTCAVLTDTLIAE